MIRPRAGGFCLDDTDLLIMLADIAVARQAGLAGVVLGELTLDARILPVPGVLLAGLLFGAFKAGSAPMQVLGLSPEVLGVVQGSIVLFIAAPPLIRAIFRLPAPQKTTVLKDLFSRRSKGDSK